MTTREDVKEMTTEQLIAEVKSLDKTIDKITTKMNEFSCALGSIRHVLREAGCKLDGGETIKLGFMLSELLKKSKDDDIADSDWLTGPDKFIVKTFLEKEREVLAMRYVCKTLHCGPNEGYSIVAKIKEEMES